MIRVAVSGACGRMGKTLVHLISNSDEFELAAAIDIQDIGNRVTDEVVIASPDELESTLKDTGTRVLIDFSIAEASVANIETASRCRTDIISGTTGFTKHQWERITKALEGTVSAVISPNFSIGVNVFWESLRFFGRNLDGYDTEIVELHHRFKRDAPSGTALECQRVLEETWGKVHDAVFGREGESLRKEGDLTFHSLRGGDEIGEHSVFFIGMGERIEVTHRMANREGFANGALLAAKYVMDAGPGLYSMRDVLGF